MKRGEVYNFCLGVKEEKRFNYVDNVINALTFLLLKVFLDIVFFRIIDFYKYWKSKDLQIVKQQSFLKLMFLNRKL